MASAAQYGLEAGGLILLIGLLAISTASCWIIFEKAGKRGWAIFVPIYNYIVLVQVSGKPTWWVIFFLIPCLWPILPIFQILMMIGLAQRFGKGSGYIAGMILLPYLFVPLLAFGGSRYTPPEPAGA